MATWLSVHNWLLDAHLCTGILGAIFSCNVVAIHGFSSQNSIAKVNKWKSGMLSLIRDQRPKSRETRQQLNTCDTRKVAYACKYTNGNYMDYISTSV